MQKDPAQRPSSALQVAAALPGGDPIAAALAAGETPSPEMVAAAPKEGALSPSIAVSLLASCLVLTIALIMLADKALLYGIVPLDKSSEVLAERARDIIHNAGYNAPAMDSMKGIAFDGGTLDYISRTDVRRERWEDLKDGQPATLLFWYRESPGYLINREPLLDSWSNPAPTVSGMTGVKLDTRGRLVYFYAVPPQIDPLRVSSPEFQAPSSNTAKAEAGTYDWSSFFTQAGLRIADFKPTTSQWSPPVPQRRARGLGGRLSGTAADSDSHRGRWLSWPAGVF